MQIRRIYILLLNTFISFVFLIPFLIIIFPLVVFWDKPSGWSWIGIAVLWLLFSVLTIALTIVSFQKPHIKRLLYINQILVYFLLDVLIIFPGYFLTSFPLYILAFLAIICLLGYVYWPSNNKLTLLLTCCVVLIFCWIFSISFKENYCWILASNSPNNSKLYSVSSPEEKTFMGSDKNASISGWLRVHLRCDKEMTFWNAVKMSLFQTSRFR